MRKTLSILVIAALATVVLDAFVGPEETIAERDATSPIQNAVLIHGLHVALPAYMKNFPADLVPLP